MIALPNSVEFVAATVACWKIGATPQPVSSRLPKRELDEIVELASPQVIVGVDPADHPDRACLPPRLGAARSRRRRPAARRGRRSVQGDDVGREHRPAEADPRRRPGLIDPDANPLLMMTVDGTHLMPGPAVPQRSVRVVDDRVCSRAITSCSAAASTPRRTLQLIDQYHPDSMYVVPTMMARISKLPRRRARPLRRVVAEGRVAPRRAVPAVAEGGVDRVARRRRDLGAVRGHRSAGGDDHQRRRVARAPRFGRPSARAAR